MGSFAVADVLGVPIPRSGGRCKGTQRGYLRCQRDILMPNRKPDAIRTKNHGPTVVDLRGFGPVDVPEPPAAVRFEISEWWYSYFASDVAMVTYTPSDLAALTRLATLYELRAEAFDQGSVNPVVRGGNNQQMEHPLLKALRGYDSAIDRLEDRFGLTPRARLNLGLQIGAATKQLSDLAKPPEPGPGEPPAVDPRDVYDV